MRVFPSLVGAACLATVACRSHDGARHEAPAAGVAPPTRSADSSPPAPPSPRDSLPAVLPDSLDRSGLASLKGTTFDLAHTDSVWVGGVRASEGHELVLVHAGTRSFVLFNNLVYQSGRPYWKVSDAVWIPVTRDSLDLAPTCVRDSAGPEGPPGKAPWVLALAVHEAYTEYYTRVVFAWRADTATGRFALEDLRGLRCENHFRGE